MKNIYNNNPCILTEQEALEILNPELSDFQSCIIEAWRNWELYGERLPELWVNHNSTTRAGIVYDYIVGSAIKRFASKKGVNYVVKNKVLTLNFKDNLAVRFKKLDKNLMASAIATNEYIRFSSQQVIPGTEQTKLFCGYLLDFTETSIDGIYITCPMGSKNVWTLRLDSSIITKVSQPELFEDEKTTILQPIGVTKKIEMKSE